MKRGLVAPFLPWERILTVDVYPHEPVLYSQSALTRAAMVERLRAHGWRVETTFNQNGPLLLIDGPWSGTCSIAVPVRLNDDHSKALEDVYALLGVVLSNVHGVRGQA